MIYTDMKTPYTWRSLPKGGARLYLRGEQIAVFALKSMAHRACEALNLISEIHADDIAQFVAEWRKEHAG